MGRNWYRGGIPLISPESANQKIADALDGGKPFMATRLGSVEIKPVLFFTVLKDKSLHDRFMLYRKGDIDNIFRQRHYVDYMLEIMCNNAGFFPKSKELLDLFVKRVVQDLGCVDLCGVWLNEYLLRDCFPAECEFCDLGALEPYDFESPWSTHLYHKRVLVIHPFAETIKHQYGRRNLVWDNREVLPEFDLQTIKAVQSIAGSAVPYNSWFSALESMENQMDSMEYDVALIGCGAYGLPLAAHAKRTGHAAIHLGGPLQILFGVKGRRWDNIESVSQFYNDFWVRPSSDETPICSGQVENGCYW